MPNDKLPRTSFQTSKPIFYLVMIAYTDLKSLVHAGFPSPRLLLEHAKFALLSVHNCLARSSTDDGIGNKTSRSPSVAANGKAA